MLTIGTVLLTSVLLAPARADTTIIVPAGTRLDVQTEGGSISIGTWERNEVQVQATYGSRDRVRVETAGAVVRVRSDRTGLGGAGIIDYRITVPTAMDLEIEGVYTAISIERAGGQVNAKTVQGAITLQGGTGQVTLSSVQGRITVEGARGRVRAQSISGGVRMRDIEGAIDVEVISGPIVLESIRSTNVSGSAVSGPVFFDGTIVGNGRYSFSTHSGPITVAVPEPLNATVSVARMSGSFSSSFESLTGGGGAREAGRRQRFVVGSGLATLELESFAGPIRVVRRGEAAPPGAAGRQ